jgi:sulfur-carrier protein
MKVMLFGMLAEKAGSAMVEVDASSVTDLRAALRTHIKGLDTLSYAIAIDRRIVKEDLPLAGNEEIAVLPPFAGG